MNIKELNQKLDTYPSVKEMIDYLKTVGINQDKIAKMLNVKSSTISLWKNKKRCPNRKYQTKLNEIYLRTKENQQVDIPTLINNILKQKNITRQQLAEIFNVCKDTISSWKKGKTYPDRVTINKLILLYDKLDDKAKITKEINDLIIMILNKKGITKKELAVILQVDISTLSAWQSGKITPNDAVIPMLIEVLINLSDANNAIKQQMIIEYLNTSGLSQKSLAQYLNLSISAVNSWVNKRNIPTDESIEKIKNLDIANNIEKEIDDSIYHVLINLLPEELRHITMLRLGLYDNRKYSIKEISKMYGLEEFYANALINRGIMLLQNYLSDFKKDVKLTRQR